MLGLFKKKKKPAAKDKRYFKLRIKEVIKETKDTTTLIFELPEGLSYLPGQYITLIFDIDGKEERRSYSLSSSPETDQLPAITVKRVDDGKVSNYLNDHMKEGDEFKILEPGGSFILQSPVNEPEHFVLFAGGSGITPLFSILKSILIRNPEDKATLIYQNRDEQSIIFRKQLDKLESQHPDRLKVVYILSKPVSEWPGLNGRMDREVVKSILLDIPEFRIQKARYYICGPSGMMDIVESALGELSIPVKNIYKERFSASEVEHTLEVKSGEPMLTERVVTIHLDGDKHEVTVPPNKSILEAALDMDIDMPFSCQSGLCTACRGKLAKGQVYMEEDEGLSDEEIAEGYVLNCVGHPLTSDVEIEID